MAFNVADRIQQVRDIKKRIKEITDEYEAKLKPWEELLEQGETTLTEYLNATGQKSAATVNGTAFHTTKVSFRVIDKPAFQEFVLDQRAWDLITWAAAPTACEAYTLENKIENDPNWVPTPPPGTFRDERLVLHVNAPPKPRKRAAEQLLDAKRAAAETNGEQYGNNEENNGEAGEEEQAAENQKAE